MRSFAAPIVAALVVAMSVPAVSSTTTPDQALSLTGAWTCRSPRGRLSRLTFRPEGDGFVATETASPLTGYTSPEQRYAPQGGGGWQVSSDSGNGVSFAGTAPRWTGATWNIDGTVTRSSPRFGSSTVAQRISYERVDAATIKRSISYGQAPGSAVGEVCARGDDPPAASLCAVRDVPAEVMRAVEPDIPAVAQVQGASGAVRVRVSLDDQGHVTGTKIESSASSLLDASALAAAKLSAYRPALRNCVPVSSDYLFAVEYSSR